MSNYERLLSQENFLDEQEEISLKIKKKLIVVYRYFLKHQLRLLGLKLIVGFIFVTLPILIFLNNFLGLLDIKNEFDNPVNLEMPKTLNNSDISRIVILPCVSIFFLMVFLICIFIWKIIELIQNPSLKHWNIYLIGKTILYFIMLIVFMSFFIKLKNSLYFIQISLTDLIYDFIDMDIIDKFYKFDNVINEFTQIIVTFIQKIISSFNPIFLYSCLYLIVINIFDLTYYINYLVINIGIISIFLNIIYAEESDIIPLLLMIVLISYCLIIIYDFIKYFKKQCVSVYRPKYYFRKTLLTFIGLKILGTAIMIISLMKYLLNEDSDYSELERDVNLLIKGLVLLITGSTLDYGEKITNFIFYSIRKEFFVYKNKKYEKFIKRIKF